MTKSELSEVCFQYVKDAQPRYSDLQTIVGYTLYMEDFLNSCKIKPQDYKKAKEVFFGVIESMMHSFEN